MWTDIEVPADQWETFQRDMAEMQQELYEMWIADMERDYA